jgi:hypothetical protein
MRRYTSANAVLQNRAAQFDDQLRNIPGKDGGNQYDDHRPSASPFSSVSANCPPPPKQTHFQTQSNPFQSPLALHNPRFTPANSNRCISEQTQFSLGSSQFRVFCLAHE